MRGSERELLVVEIGDRCEMHLVAENQPWTLNPIKRAHDAMAFLQRRPVESWFPRLSR
jgi:hypothetical protein